MLVKFVALNNLRFPGCFGMHILAVGGIKSFGVLFVEFEHRFDTTSRALASVQAVTTTFMMGMCPVSNALSKKFGCRRIVFIGGIFMGLGFVLSSFVQSYQWLYLTYGVISGFGFGLSYAPCIVFVGHHFKKYRALANGLSVSGSGVGTFLFPICINKFIVWYGLGGALLLLGAIMFNCCVCAMLFRPISSYKDRKIRNKVLKSTIESHPTEAKEVLLEKLEQNGSRNNILNVEEMSDLNGTTKNNALTADTTQILSKPVEGQQLLDSKTKASPMFDWKLLTNPVFLVFLTSTSVTNFAYPNVFIMVPSYGEEIGLDKSTSALMVSIIGISDLVGRIFFGWFSDLRLVPRKYEFMFTMGISGVLSLILPFVKGYAALIAYCSTYGFFAGAYIALIAVVLVDTLGIENLSGAFGFVGFGMTIGLLGGPPIVGGLRDGTGTWDNSFMFVALIAIVGAMIILFEPLAQRYINKKSIKKVTEI
ncbi:monocarboxylate transporter 12-B isoform X1 [Patella vulgata]|uniref:monocarboxylate transporter 12-B isoform X1 n=1 Tax=Patella vulgata TaxID=6465 RepID=UPI00217FB7AD|nr:monocarboxylate transporter 12-B isoform X1 [Patella vulgata]